MTSSLTALATQTFETTTNELPFPPVMAGVGTLAVFLLLLGVLWSFRKTAIGMTDPEHDDRERH